MKFEIELADRFYAQLRDPDSLGKYETQIWRGIKKDIDWNNLNDLQKLENRKSDLVHKRKVDSIYSKSAILYEDNVIDLGYLIYNFLEDTEMVVQKISIAPSLSKEELIFMRLRTMLFCELYSLNKHREIEKGGHVLYSEVVEGIIQELSNSQSYVEYGLQEMNKKYKLVIDLFNLKPYMKE